MNELQLLLKKKWFPDKPYIILFCLNRWRDQVVGHGDWPHVFAYQRACWPSHTVPVLDPGPSSLLCLQWQLCDCVGSRRHSSWPYSGKNCLLILPLKKSSQDTSLCRMGCIAYGDHGRSLLISWWETRVLSVLIICSPSVCSKMVILQNKINFRWCWGSYCFNSMKCKAGNFLGILQGNGCCIAATLPILGS